MANISDDPSGPLRDGRWGESAHSGGQPKTHGFVCSSYDIRCMTSYKEKNDLAASRNDHAVIFGLLTVLGIRDKPTVLKIQHTTKEYTKLSTTSSLSNQRHRIWKAHRCQSHTISEGLRLDFSDGLRDVQADQRTASCKSTASDLRHGVWDAHLKN